MYEAAQGHSISLIAIVVIIQAMLAGIGKWKEIKAKRKNEDSSQPPVDTEAIKNAAILSHQVTEIHQRSQATEGALRELAQVCRESVAVSREMLDTTRHNTRAVEKLTDKICVRFRELERK